MDILRRCESCEYFDSDGILPDVCLNQDSELFLDYVCGDTSCEMWQRRKEPEG